MSTVGLSVVRIDSSHFGLSTEAASVISASTGHGSKF